MGNNLQKSSDVENVLSATDVVSLIGRYITLKKAGTSYKGLCPFHKEKTPSFVVNPQKQIYYCFGCGKGGDAINFLTSYEKMPFREALETLAQENGIELSKFTPVDKEKARKELEKRESIYRINLDALYFYRESLVRTQGKAASYLDGRGLSRRAQESFMIGYAPHGWGNVLKYLKSKGHSEEGIVEAGLAVKHEKNGRCYDRFRDRVIFPIHNAKNQVVGFGARLIPPAPDNAPKYINSPETLVFNKRNNLFGLNFASKRLRESGYAVITEGYLDVISAHEMGLCEAVAPLGTALTDSQIKLLCRYTNYAILVFDSDNAGIKAVYRAFENLAGSRMKSAVLLLPPGEDLDSFVRKFGADAFAEKLRAAVPTIEFILKHIVSTSNLSSIDGEVECVAKAIPLLKKISDPLALSRYIAYFSEVTKISKRGIEEAIYKEKIERPPKKNITRRETRQVLGNQGLRKARIDFVKQIIRDSNSVKECLEEFGPSDFGEDYLKVVFSVLKSEVAKGEVSFTGRLLPKLENDESVNFFSSVLMEKSPLEFTAQHIEQCVGAIRQEKVKKRIREIQGDIRESSKGGKSLNPELIREYTELSKLLKCPKGAS